MFGRIKSYLYKLYITLSNVRGIGKPLITTSISELFDNYREFCVNNCEIEYQALIEKLAIPKETYKYVGGILYKQNVVFVPNKAESVLCKKGSTIKLVGNLPVGDYKWTGGAISNGNLYFFPRKSADLLIFDGEKLSKINGLKYDGEHHYGGVLWNNIIIQPPRSTSHFLIWNLNSKTSKRKKICPKFLAQFFRYNCSVLHPNGFIYFFPENGRIIKLNPTNMKFRFIGNWINTMIFDAKILPDGNIYGFSTNQGGIVKFDIATETIEVLYAELSIESYGTKLGANGKIYSIPGSGTIVWEYDYLSNSIRKLYDLKDDCYAKYAGGCTDKKGVIYGAPAFADNVLSLVPNREIEIPDDLYETFWVDCY